MRPRPKVPKTKARAEVRGAEVRGYEAEANTLYIKNYTNIQMNVTVDLNKCLSNG